MNAEECREKLIQVKKKLTDALLSQGSEKQYWSNMKAWFKHRISKEEFDIEARQLLPDELTHLHNEFLLAVFTKCHVVGTSSGTKESSSQMSMRAKRNKRKMQAVKRKFDNRFVPAPVISYLPTPDMLREKEKNCAPTIETLLSQNVALCSRSLEIPSMSDMNGRVAVITWERGLDDHADEISHLMIMAIHVFLKNIITALCCQRSAYKIKNKDFKHSVGCTADNPYLLQNRLRSTLFGSRQCTKKYGTDKPTYDEAEQIAIESIGRASQVLPPHKQAVNMQDLFFVLQNNRTLLPSHTVYALCIERVIANLWHPDNEEIEQDRKFSNLDQVPENYKDQSSGNQVLSF